MSKKYTSRVQFAITPDTRDRLEREASRRHLDVSKTARALLIEALEPYEAYAEENPPRRRPYEVRLTEKEHCWLLKRNYIIVPVDEDK